MRVRFPVNDVGGKSPGSTGRLPKKGAKACHTDTGACGRIVKLSPLKGTADLLYNEGGYEELPPEKLGHPQR